MRARKDGLTYIYIPLSHISGLVPCCVVSDRGTSEYVRASAHVPCQGKRRIILEGCSKKATDTARDGNNDVSMQKQLSFC